MRGRRTLNYENKPAPWLLGLFHKEWRPYQYEAIKQIVKTFTDKRIAILEAPTGTGKTAIATAIGNHENSFQKVTVVVQNLGLLNQYHDYGFAILKGRQAYPCVNRKRVETWKSQYNRIPTAADCPYAEMYQCQQGHKCPYMKAREKALSSSRMACTYKYAALSNKVQDRTGLFVMDEIHNAVNEILSIGSFTMDDIQRESFEMPEFPLKEYGNGEGDLLDKEAFYEVTGWINKSMRCLGQMNLFDEISPEGAKKKKMLERFEGLLELLAACKDEVFYKCAPKKVWDNGKYREVLAIEFKTISPAYIYHKMTGNKNNILMMSATVGSPSALVAGELRIGKEDYKYLKYPHPVPADKRPIYNIAAGKMSYSNLKKNPWLYDKQAKNIAEWIISHTEDDWRGIVLTTSYKKIKKLRDGLSRYLGEERIFENESNSLQERISEFMVDDTPSMVHVDTIQGWGTGVDLRGDIARYCVVAGVPFANPTDSFQRIRMSTKSGKAYLTAYAFNAVQQAAGRVSRGVKRDGDYLLNVGAIADKMALSPWAMHHYSDWFREAIVLES
jgi:Rad3-related DNA helicase